MSALAKPLIHSTTPTNKVGGVSPVVPIEHVINISTLDLAPFAGAASGKYQTIFTILNTANLPETITWEYASAAARDAEFAQIIAAVSLAV